MRLAVEYTMHLPRLCEVAVGVVQVVSYAGWGGGQRFNILDRGLRGEAVKRRFAASHHGAAYELPPHQISRRGWQSTSSKACPAVERGSTGPRQSRLVIKTFGLLQLTI